MRKPKQDIIELPPVIEQLAHNLVAIVAKSAEEHLADMLNKPEEPNKTTGIQSWAQIIATSTEDKVEDWNSKDFVHWFVQQLQQQLEIPYVLEYSRDCSAINKIQDQLEQAGLKGNQNTKKFIEWALSKYSQIKEEYERFDLPTLGKTINTFLQQEESVDTPEVRKLNVDIKLEMQKHISQNAKTAMVQLLRQFGIPLTTELYVSQGYSLDKVVDGISNRLKHFSDNDIIALQSAAQKSIDFSPYPEWFHCLNWREKFSEYWETHNFKSLKWWRDKDYAGKYAIEYESFKGE